MDKKTFLELPKVEQDRLASKYGVTRSGINNSEVKDEELVKISELKPIKEERDEKPKEKVRKSVVKKVSKRLSGRRIVAKSKSRKK